MLIQCPFSKCVEVCKQLHRKLDLLYKAYNIYLVNKIIFSQLEQHLYRYNNVTITVSVSTVIKLPTI